MSNDLAIAAVTSTLRNVLLAGYADMPAVTVTTRPPAQARTGNERPSQLNLFLFQTEPNAAFVNADPIGRARSGESARPALALDLHYLITAFGEDDEEVDGHRVLGRALRVLHDHPLLRGDDIASALPESDLADQAERVRATFLPLGIEEISKLWTAFQSEYRLSAAYRASVVLIDTTTPISAALPVLTRGPGDAGVVAQPDLTPPFPTVVAAALPEQRIAAHLGDEIELAGHHLAGDSVEVVLRHSLLADAVVVAAEAPATDSSVRFVLPDLPAAVPVGVWAVAARIVRAGEPDRTTNEIPIAVAPRITSIAPDPAPRVGGDVTLTIVLRPDVRPGQRAALLLGSREVLADSVAANTDTLVFDVVDAAAGGHFVRVRVDGIDSNLIDRSTTPPTFDATRRVTVT